MKKTLSGKGELEGRGGIPSRKEHRWCCWGICWEAQRDKEETRGLGIWRSPVTLAHLLLPWWDPFPWSTWVVMEPQTLSPPLALPSSPLATSSVLWVCFCFVDRFFCTIFLISHESDIIWCLPFSFRLTSLCMIISSCTYAAANGIISSFLMPE